LAGKGISGVALGMATAGGILMYFAINNIPMLDGLRSLVKGKIPTGATTGASKGVAAALAGIASKAQSTADAASSAGSPTSQFASTTGQKIADDARKYLGVPYVWGGASPSGFDCSGLVTWVLHHDLGINLPDNNHTVTGQFLVWGGAKDVPRSTASAGDLCCSMEHIGIAVDSSNMIHAPDFGEVVKIGPIQAGMAIRRVTAAAASVQGAEDSQKGHL
jgi:cell wall-associated NlpC family hydrolase